ncbi:MAG: hypothetical protein EPN40_14250 [Rhodanobacteraceae bacterium]|nr:MAG: hypothetical protein EPN40_14250 [Rhodanobacteraceae bacterium]
MIADFAIRSSAAASPAASGRVVTRDACLRDTLIERFGAPVWEPQDEADAPTVGSVWRRASNATDRALRLARRAVANARADVRACRAVGYDEREPEIFGDAQAFLCTALRRMREVMGALRAAERTTRRIAREKSERGIAVAESHHRSRAAVAVIAAKLHGLVHACVHAARTTTSPVVLA